MSLLQEALKRKEHDEAQPNPEGGSLGNAPAALPPAVNLPSGGLPDGGKNQIIPQDTPPQSMPVLAPSQSTASQPAPQLVRRSLSEGGSLGAGWPILASAPALMLRNEEPLANPGRRKTSLLWVIVAAIAILTGLTVAAGFVFFIYRWLPPMKAKIGQPAGQIHKTDATSGNTNMIIGQPIPAAGRETAERTEETTQQPVSPEAFVPKHQSESESGRGEPQSEKNLEAGDTGSKPVAVKAGLHRDEPAPARAKAPPVSSPAVRWPALKLTGILHGSGPAESTAIINGKMIGAGQTIEGVMIVEIQANHVLLKYGSEKKFLRVGATLY